MKRLILMRHGDAPRNFVDDERELSEIGALEAEITGKYIKDKYKVDYICCSSAQRNKQTLKVIQKFIDVVDISFSEDIYKNDHEILKDVVRSFSREFETALLIGHSPSLLSFGLACNLGGYDDWYEHVNMGMKTAEIIVLECDEASDWDSFIDLGAKIKDIFMPKIVS